MTFRQPVGDFFAPFFRVRFVDVSKLDAGTVALGADGEQLPNLFAETGERVEFVSSGEETTWRVGEDDQMSQLRSYATSLEVTTKGEAHSIAKLHMEPMYADALRIVDHQAIQKNSLMIAEWGYLDAKSGALNENKYSKTGVFAITTPSLNISESGATIDIIGTDIFGTTMVRRETRRKWDRNGDYSADISIIEELVKRNGMELDVSGAGLAPVAQVKNAFSGLAAPAGPAFVDTRVGPFATHSLLITHPLANESPVVEQNDNDWVFFQRLLASNNCSFSTQGRTVNIFDWNEVKRGQAQYRLMMYAQPQNDTDIPMESFSTAALEYLFHPATAFGVKVITTDTDTGKDVDAANPENASPGVYNSTTDAGNLTLGKKSVTGPESANGRSFDVKGVGHLTPAPKVDEGQAGKSFYMPFSTANLAELAKQPARKGAMNFEAQATIPGTPAIETMQIVEVVGVGRVMGGFYLVNEATHTIDTSGYSTQLNLIREGSSGDPVAGTGEQPTAQANPEPAESGAKGDAVSATPAELSS